MQPSNEQTIFAIAAIALLFLAALKWPDITIILAKKQAPPPRVPLLERVRMIESNIKYLKPWMGMQAVENCNTMVYNFRLDYHDEAACEVEATRLYDLLAIKALEVTPPPNLDAERGDTILKTVFKDLK